MTTRPSPAEPNDHPARRRGHVRLAWMLWALAVFIWLLGLGLDLLNGASSVIGERFILLLLLLYSTVGALIAARYPKNAVGWLLLVGPLGPYLTGVVDSYATYALITHPGALPAGALMAWLGTWVGNLGFGLLLIFTPLVFPNGRLLSRRWRAVVWIGVLAEVVQFTYALRPGPIGTFPIDNPFGLQGAASTFALIEQFGEVPLLLAIVSAWVSLLLRFRRASGEERQQLKWLGYAGLLVIVVSIVGTFAGTLFTIPEMVLNLAFLFVVTAFPLSIGIAILKYRLYDIDIIIRRTLVYSSLTLILALVYVGCIVASRAFVAPLTGGSELAIVGSTLAIAALFTPLRRRIQNTIDKRFYRRKYDAAKVLAAFGATVRDETNLETLTAEMLKVVDETMRPEFVGLWLREPEQNRGAG
jgi:hypothetical protein